MTSARSVMLDELTELAQATVAQFPGAPGVERFDESGPALLLANGYRWHLRVPQRDEPVVANLLNPELAPVDAMPRLTLAALGTAQLPVKIAALSLLAQDPTAPCATLIHRDVLARLEKDLSGPS